ncbi:MAG: metal ABC transporter substrate-binding protein [bacterium]|jgi:ABC-type Zn uptake system ZnuABC Zn-binding protein ZnuA
MKLSILLIAVSLVLAALSMPPGAGEGNAAEPGHLRIATSIYPITMLVEEIGGDRVDVTTVVPPGADPHHFELTPSSARAIHEADAVLMIGGDFDTWMMGDGHRANKVCGTFNQVFADSLIELGSTFNPHFWLDPLFACKMGEYICITMVTIDPRNASYYEKRLAEFRARMDSLHAGIRARIAESGLAGFVSFHPAWTYFARRYGLLEAGVVEKFPEYEPSARWVADLIRRIESEHVPIMIVEETSDPGIVEGIVNDTDIEVVVLDPVGDPAVPGRDTYSGLMNHNVSLLERAARRD